MNRRKGPPDEQEMPRLVREALADLRSVPEPDPDSWDLARQTYVDEAQAVAGDIERAASHTEEEGTGTGFKAFLLPLWERRPRSMLARLLILLSVVFGGTLGTVRATENSVPGSPLYPVKLQVEDLRTARVEEPMERVERALNGAERRLEEAEKLAERGLAIPPELGERYAEHVSDALQAMETLTGPAQSEAQEEIAEELGDHLEKLAELRALVAEDEQTLTRMRRAIEETAPQLEGFSVEFDDDDDGDDVDDNDDVEDDDGNGDDAVGDDDSGDDDDGEDDGGDDAIGDDDSGDDDDGENDGGDDAIGDDGSGDDGDDDDDD